MARVKVIAIGSEADLIWFRRAMTEQSKIMMIYSKAIRPNKKDNLKHCEMSFGKWPYGRSKEPEKRKSVKD